MRKLYGYSYDEMGKNLCLTGAAYGKIEKGYTALYEQRLQSIAEIFKLPLPLLTDDKYDLVLYVDEQGKLKVDLVCLDKTTEETPSWLANLLQMQEKIMGQNAEILNRLNKPRGKK